MPLQEFQRGGRSAGLEGPGPFRQRANDPPPRPSARLQDQAQPLAHNHVLAGPGLAARAGQNFPRTVGQRAQEQPLPRASRRLPAADQPRRDHPRVVPGQDVAAVQQPRQLVEMMVRHPPAGAVQHQQPRLLARLRRVLGNQLRGQVEIKVAGTQGRSSSFLRIISRSRPSQKELLPPCRPWPTALPVHQIVRLRVGPCRWLW